MVRELPRATGSETERDRERTNSKTAVVLVKGDKVECHDFKYADLGPDSGTV